eukprot:1161047-Pelagomonas_calceolata.AAC.5
MPSLQPCTTHNSTILLFLCGSAKGCLRQVLCNANQSNEESSNYAPATGGSARANLLETGDVQEGTWKHMPADC